MSDYTHSAGSRGEDRAAAYLEERGYRILHRNLRLSRFEVDLICLDGDCLVFVEVKAASGEKFGHPATWIDQKKQDNLRQAAQIYIEQNNIAQTDIRFDAVTIDQGRIEHYPNAF